MSPMEASPGVARFSPPRHLPRRVISRRVAFLRILAFVAIGFFYLVLFSGGTPESRLAYALAAAVGFINPVWSLYTIAFLGGLYLNSSGSNHMNILIDALAVGALLGELRLLGRMDEEVLDDPSISMAREERDPFAFQNLNWGIWPAAAIGILAIVYASAMPSAVFSIFEEGNTQDLPWLRYTTHKMIWWWESEVQWGLRAAMNWTVGIGLAAVAARRATTLRVARFFKFGAAGLALVCILGLLEVVCSRLGHPQWFTLSSFRPPNLHPYQEGRFQATAGHAGWLGQWMLLMAPGLVYFFREKGLKKKSLAFVATAIVLLCWVLTGARAAWMGLAAGLMAFALFLVLSRLLPKRLVAIGALAVVVLLGLVGTVAYFAGGDVLAERIARTASLSGRENYFSSGLIFLREYPFGIGLGQHFTHYQDWLTPVSFFYYQNDHVTSHNLLLHLAIEGGLPLAGLFLAGFLVLLVEIYQAWRPATPEAKFALLLLLTALIAIMVNGLAQYFFYIRAVEFAFWILAGLSIGLARRYGPRRAILDHSAVRPIILVLCGFFAAVTISAHAERPLIDDYSRGWKLLAPGEEFTGSPLVKWTTKKDRFAIEPLATRVTFTLHRVGLPSRVTVNWPDGKQTILDMAPGQTARVTRDLQSHGTTSRLEKREWVEIVTDVTYTPSRWEPNSRDKRPLGVYINEFFVWFPWHIEEERQEAKPQ